jgi:tetratricopeptide (TPR) repeat protein
MGKHQESTGIDAASLKKPPVEHPVFICYRQSDGKRYARWIYSTLEESLKGCGDGTPVYFDQAAPATSDWTAVHLPALEQACCLVVIATPGLCADLGGDDWVQKELDWWLKHRKAAPILIDAFGEGDRWIPRKIKSRWPLAQRVNLDRDLWAQANEEDHQQIRAQVGQQIIGVIKGSRFEVAAQDFQRKRRMKRVAMVAPIMAAAAGLVYLGYMQTARYQIDTIAKSAPVQAVAEHFAPLGEDASAIRYYLRALATFRPKDARNAAEHIRKLDAKSVALGSVAEGEADAGQRARARDTFQEALHTAEQINDAASRVTTLALIAEGQAKAGQSVEAGEAWDKAWENALLIAQNSPDYPAKVQLINWISVTQRNAGQLSEAARSAWQIPDSLERVLALVSIAEEQAKGSDLAGADQTLAQAQSAALNVRESEKQPLLLYSIAYGQAYVRHFDDAERTARRISDPTTKVDALRAIAEAEARVAGMDTDAERIVKLMKNPEDKEKTLSNIAVAQAQTGQFTMALRTADRITKPGDVLRVIAEAQAEAGQFEDARSTVTRITDPGLRNGALVRIAERLAQVSRVDEALAMLRQIDESRVNADEVRVRIAAAQAGAGRWNAAVRTATNLGDSLHQLRAYAGIVNQYAISKRPSLNASLRLTEGEQ